MEVQIEKFPNHLQREDKLPCPPSLRNSPLHIQKFTSWFCFFLFKKSKGGDMTHKKKEPQSLCTSFLYPQMAFRGRARCSLSHHGVHTFIKDDKGLCCFCKLLRRLPWALQYHHITSDHQEAIPKTQLRGCKGRMWIQTRLLTANSLEWWGHSYSQESLRGKLSWCLCIPHPWTNLTA